MKILNCIKFITALVVIGYTSQALTEEKSKDSLFDFHWSLGTRGIYSSGISDPYVYNRSGVSGEIRSGYVDVSANIQRYLHYQITDGSGVYEYRSFNEAGFAVTAYLFKIISLGGEYSRADDFDDLKRDTLTGSVELNISPVVLTGEYTYEDFRYNIGSSAIETEKHDYSMEFEYNISDKLSADLGYTYSDLYFNSLDYTYYKNIFRAGFTSTPYDYFFLIAGLSAGKDSADYYIYGADIGVTLKVYSHIKFSFAYNIAYYTPAASESSDGKGRSGHGSGSSINPYLEEDKIGESYYSQVISFGMSLSF